MTAKTIIAAAAGVVVMAGAAFGSVKLANTLSEQAENSVAEQGEGRLIEGRYYLNGDKSTNNFWEVKDGKIALRGDREELVNMLYEHSLEQHRSFGTELTDELLDSIRKNMEETVDQNMQENDLIVQSVGSSYAVVNNYRTTDDGTVAGACIMFDGEKTLWIYKSAPYILID